MLSLSFCITLFTASTLALNFDWEAIQLTKVETHSYPAIRFGNVGDAIPRKVCKSVPGDADWPNDAEWKRFNDTLGGVLLKPKPLALPCYTGPFYDQAKCESLKTGWGNMTLHANDPISVCSQWASGDACVPASQPNSTCSQGGFPVYVVNATTARHVQMALNFARNMNIRIVIKNSGHDFNGRNLGGYALSVWVHNLRGAEYHENYVATGYSGRAVAVGGGSPAMDFYSLRTTYNTTMHLPGGSSVGVAGAYSQGGGHSSWSTIYGLSADNVLQINAVTADGRLVTADAQTNEDLYWAFRGGGGGNFGIVTSMVIATFPQTPLTSSSITFSTVPITGQATSNLTADVFWEGMKAYWDFCIPFCDAGGFGYNFIRHAASQNVTGLTFTTSISLPNYTLSETRAFVRPLLERLTEIGIPITIPQLQLKRSTNTQPTEDDGPLGTTAIGDSVHNTLIASRLFLRSNFDNAESVEEMNQAIRRFVEEGGYDFHGQNYNPNPSSRLTPPNALHPAFRKAIMHAQGYETNAHWDGVSPVLSYSEQKAHHDRLQGYMQQWRDITPGSGSYMNEGDAQTPNFKDDFWGDNYERLLRVKRERDPWGVFWVVGGVGSDAWEVKGREKFVTQHGVLCRAD
ncbi:FAD/FMN-containing isoamyl alcohol oxidase-like protein MreA [Massarina eburnea CBS 473.64]|uniref:FAD/FMN-containing isoamyl alcohol oxidase-like protein MreA n=1 Tax=Massarina eburnea CBS 473.64 TaxID=1395130 RepID=A0A6A6RVZ4_9PLEO|nr:FAD/FMN-containing isoamyl alcohol oxidase-like protein MreA [Massarina eburnea CBS 473.64]